MFIDGPRFPERISSGSRGGPMYNTTVESALSGKKVKNSNWTYPLHKYDITYGIRDIEDLLQVLNFFHAAGGRAHTFRFKDWVDYKSSGTYRGAITAADQNLGVGDGANADFYLVKNYVVGVATRERKISKPVSGTLLVALDGVETTAYSIDTKGLITFDTPPGSGAVVTAGYEFDVPCSFDDDYLPTTMEEYLNLSVSVTVSEDRI